MIRSFTPAVIKIFNLIPGDRGRPLTDIVSRMNYKHLESDILAVFGSGEVIERSVSFADGKDHYLARILPYRGSANRIEGVVVTFVDVTNIVAAEEEQKALAAELSHRVKNSLAVVSSIAERTLESGESKDDFVSRLLALAQTHDLLSRSRLVRGVAARPDPGGACPAPGRQRRQCDGERTAGAAEAARRTILGDGAPRACHQRREIRCLVGP